jgi:spermidine synthase
VAGPRLYRRRTTALTVAVFLSGATLLGLEIAASRVLAPAFGSSLYVWGALIGVVLTGLAIGYWAGGALADRWPTPHLFVGSLALGAVLVLAVPVADEDVIARVVERSLGPRLDPLVAAVILFGPASVVLAAATPIAVRLATRSLDTLGTTAGRLFAVSTAGSIAGTFATAFWLIPEFGTDQVIAVGAVALLAAAAVVAFAERLMAPGAALAVAAGAAVLAVTALAPEAGGRIEASSVQNFSPSYRLAEKRVPRRLDPADVAALAAGFEVREARDTRYHRLLVVDDDDSRYLRFDNSFQSGMYLDSPFRTRFAYTDYLHLGLAYAPTARRVLFIGLGGGSVQKRMWRDFPALRLHTVEIDPAVVDAAYRWFALPRDPRLTVEVDDGRRFLRRDTRRWNLIVVDAYYADTIPFHLATAEFVRLVRSRLIPGGVVAVNVIGAMAGDTSRLLRSITRTYASAFPTVALHPVYLGRTDRVADEPRNVVLVATDAAAPTRIFLQRRWDRVRERATGAPDLRQAIRDRWERPLRVDDVPLLTDAYAPTDALLYP